MTNGESARAFLKGEKLPKLARLAGHRFRWHVAESFAKHRGRLHGDELAAQIKADLCAESAIPIWLWGVVLKLAIEGLMLFLERWWNQNRKETWEFPILKRGGAT